MSSTKNVLVTGGAGYIGSHACKALRRAGYCPVTVDNLSTGWRDAIKFGPFIECDLLNKQALKKAFRDYDPIAVMHFGGLSQVGESVIKPNLYWSNNVIGTFNLLEAAVEQGCDKLVFSSTCATYGDNDGVVLDENCIQRPKNPYSKSKLAIENMLQDFAIATDLKFVIFRYFNVAGADGDAEIGEVHRPETHLIPIILDVAMGKRHAVKIFGTDYDTRDGTCVRDYVHVGDLVDAHILGLNWLEQGNVSKIYNLGTGKGFSVKEVIDIAARVTNCQVRIVEGKRRNGDCAKLVSGSMLAKEELGWVPSRSSLEQMVSDAWRWHRLDAYQEKQ